MGLILRSATIELEGSNITPHTLNDSKYNLTTMARWAVLGGNIQLDEGTGRQIWKCLDPLNCVASVAFWKHGTWVQTWTWNFQGTLHE